MQSSIELQLEEVLKKYTSLELDAEKLLLSGDLIVDKVDGDDYEVEIDFSCFPDRFPMVWETGERIPRKSDRHIYSTKGNCCFTTKTMEEILLKTEVKTLLDFFDKILIPFLQNNSYYEINKCYKNGEYLHDIGLATIQTYQDILDIKDIRMVYHMVKKRLFDKYKIRPNELCYCGSGIKIKKCKNHAERFKRFRLISTETLEFDLLSFKDLAVRVLIEEMSKMKQRNLLTD